MRNSRDVRPALADLPSTPSLTDPALEILAELLTMPTAPFAEHYVIDCVRRFCVYHPDIKLTQDPAGNVLLRLRRESAAVARPLCLTAHMDHPGFVAIHMIGPGRLKASWRGGVPIEYFEGARVRFYDETRWIRGRVVSTRPVREHDTLRVDTTEIDVKGDVPPGSVGMWDFPDPRVRGERVLARGCDDVAGTAAVLSALHRVHETRGPCDIYALLTRAEEVGFVGAIAACRHRTIPRKCLVVTVETSSELPHVKMGRGPILRVGDKASTFTPAATAYCRAVADDLTIRDRAFRYQRHLMDAGTCEASVFCQFGYDATGLCIALGNYHNVNRRTKRLAPESIHLDDYELLVRWFVALAQSATPYTGADEGFASRLERIERSYARLLAGSVRSPR